MDSSLGKIMSHVYELEGLVLVIDKHAEETPDFVLSMLKDKAKALAEEVQLYQLPEKAEPSEVAETADAEPEPQSAPEPAATVQEPEQSDDDDDFRQPEEEEAPKEVFSSDYVEPEHRVDNEEEDTITVEEFNRGVDELQQIMDSVGYYGKEPKQDQEDGESTPAEAEAVDTNNDANKPSDLRVDEKIQRSLSKNLHKAFSINDRFRFRRELFANSELDWNEALDMVAAMKSYDEAEEYFYDDLGWDASSEDVADFMAVIKNHFA